MQEKLKQYIIDNLEKEPKTKRFFDNFFKKNILFETDDEESNLYSADASYEETPLYHRKVYGLEKRKDIKNYIEENEDKSSFQNLLFKYIDERNLKDSDVYNKVHIDRRLFSKIRSNDNYHPSKETIILLGLSLQLSE
ncbi:MAG: hypothetical protein IJ093_04355 [Bacilli bacterium]|nr:hypothetical protein [Bacilli bacterium]